MIAPPAYVIEEARIVALRSPCLKSRRGVVLFNRELADLCERRGAALDTSVIASVGFNSPPPGVFYCTGTETCRRDCAKLCLHAEERAIRAAGRLDDRDDLELVHVKVVGGRVVPGGGPSCWQCSRLIVETRLRGVWLYQVDEADPRVEFLGRWHFYTAEDFHRETLRACDLGDQEFR